MTEPQRPWGELSAEEQEVEKARLRAEEVEPEPGWNSYSFWDKYWALRRGLTTDTTRPNDDVSRSLEAPRQSLQASNERAASYLRAQTDEPLKPSEGRGRRLRLSFEVSLRWWR